MADPREPTPGPVPDVARLMRELREGVAVYRSAWAVRQAAGAALPQRDEYALPELTAFDGEAFVRMAYEATLRRPPDDAGLAYHAGNLARGEVGKAELLRRLAFSEEGRAIGVRIRGLVREQRAVHDDATPALNATPPGGGDWHVNDLMRLHDAPFVEAAYRVLLRREADAEGLRRNLEALRSGQVGKFDVIAALHRSPEGRAAGVRLRGFRSPWLMSRARAIPLLGRLFALAGALAAARGVARRVERLESELWRSNGELRRREDALADRVEGEFEWVMRRHATAQMVVRALASRDRAAAAVRARMEESIAQARAHEVHVDDRFARLDSAIRTKLDAVERELQDSWLESSRRYAESMGALAAEVQSSLARAQDRIGDLGREVAEGLEEKARRAVEEAHARAATGGLPAQAWDQLYHAFEERFRAPSEELRSRLEGYLPRVAEVCRQHPGHPVLDIGCGRGEWLALLREHGLPARGVDLNADMVELCRAQGLEVLHADALEHLRQLEPGSLAVVTGFHIVEHLPFAGLVAMMDAAFRALRPGGLVAFETPNPENLVVGACNFYVDPTHKRPLPPPLLSFVAAQRGFENVEVVRLGDLAANLPDAFDASDPNQRFNTFIHALRYNFFSAPDYAVLARKP